MLLPYLCSCLAACSKFCLFCYLDHLLRHQCKNAIAELGEEGLLLDALAIVAQPLAAVVGVISAEGCKAANMDLSQLSMHCKRPPYQLQLQLQQVRLWHLKIAIIQPFAIVDINC